MKKIIFSLALTSVLALTTMESKAIIHQGSANKTGGNGITTITFNCPGAGICYVGGSSIGSHIEIYGYPGDWIIVGYKVSEDGDDSKDKISVELN
jgi:hypothetical protein